MKENEYQCYHCKNIYEKGWSDEKAEQEATEIFGKHPDDWNSEKRVLCDDCFNEMNPLSHIELLEKTKKNI